MWEIDRYICLGVLVVLSLIDIYKHKVPGHILISGIVCVAAYHLVDHKVPLTVVAGGMGIGGIFLAMSKVTDERIGYGDSLGIMILGAYLGIWKIVEVLMGAFFMLGVCSVLVLCLKKMSKGIAFPFFPFLTAGYALVLLAEGGMI